MPKLHIIQLKAGEDVQTALHAYLMQKDWKAGVIVAGVGSIYDVTLNNPMDHNTPPTLQTIRVEKPCEIVSFMGEITRKEDMPSGMPCMIMDTPSQYVTHIHASVSHDDGSVQGGGFRNATVLRAINIYVLEIE